MSDVFISYSSKDRQVAKRLAHALGEAGYAVWWDRELRTGTKYLAEIDRELRAARSILVVWSRRSVESEWVWAEANYAREEGKLVPVRIDDAELPVVFKQRQTAELKSWRGDTASKAFRKLAADIADLLGRAPAAAAETAGSEDEELAEGDAIVVGRGIHLDSVTAGDIVGIKTDSGDAVPRTGPIDVGGKAHVKNSVIGDLAGVKIQTGRSGGREGDSGDED